MTPPVRDIAALSYVSSQLSPAWILFFSPAGSMHKKNPIPRARSRRGGSPEELYQLVIYTSVAQPKPSLTHHLLPARIQVSAGLPGSWGAAQHGLVVFFFSFKDKSLLLKMF